MAILKLPWERCWCFSTVRTGSIASGIYAVVCALLRIVGVIVEEVVVDEELEEIRNGTDALTYETHEAEYEFEKAIGYVELALALLLFWAGVCLLIGIYKNQAILLLPFVLLFFIIVVIEALFVVMVLLALILLPFLFVFLTLIVMVAFLFVDTSCLLCVLSHFLNLRAGREPMRAVYRRQGQRMTEEDEPAHYFGEAALPTKELGPPTDSMKYSPMVDLPVGEEAPPPYRDV